MVFAQQSIDCGPSRAGSSAAGLRSTNRVVCGRAHTLESAAPNRRRRERTRPLAATGAIGACRAGGEIQVAISTTSATRSVSCNGRSWDFRVAPTSQKRRVFFFLQFCCEVNASIESSKQKLRLDHAVCSLAASRGLVPRFPLVLALAQRSSQKAKKRACLITCTDGEPDDRRRPTRSC